MKKSLFVLIFAALLLFSACQKAPEFTHEVVSQPPDLVITVPEGSVTRTSFYGDWTYLDENGQEMTMSRRADMVENWWAKEPQLVAADQTAQLSFALPPDEISVSRYSVTDGSSTFCELTENGELPLTDGCWTYLFMAQWTDESRPYHGWARYTVCIEKK